MKGKRTILRHVFFSWLIFSVFYIFSAYHKPFHVDEFYSWVYTERCSWEDILSLRVQHGIGHPPLYHLLQKLVQTVLHPYHYLHVRLANYLIGSLFIVLFVRFILKQKYIPFFCYGLAGSATILEIFIFSRMWGLICLSSFLLMWAGEEYFKSQKRRYLLLFFGSCVLGFSSDYSFIVLSLYFVIILFWRRFYLVYLVYLYFIILFISLFTVLYRVAMTQEASFAFLLFYQIRDLGLLFLKTINVLFNFWFVELILISVLIFGILTVLEIFRRNNLKDCNLNILAKYFSFLISFCLDKLKHIFDLNRDYNRVLLTVIGSWLIVLTFNPVFWTGIIRKRFLTILCPFLLLIIIRNYHKNALHVLTVILFCSGLIFASSNRVAGVYPPPSFTEDIPIIYQNEWAYATQYLRRPKRLPQNEFLADFSSFDMRCRLCTMGTNNIPFEQYNLLWVVWSNRSDPDKFMPADFARTREGLANLTWLDKLQFKYLTPLPKTQYLVFKYRKIVDIQ